MLLFSKIYPAFQQKSRRNVGKFLIHVTKSTTFQNHNHTKITNLTADVANLSKLLRLYFGWS